MNPATVGMFMYIQIIYAYLFDMMVFDTSLSTLQLAGASIVFVFSVAAAIDKNRAPDEKLSADASQIDESTASDDYKKESV